MIRGKVKTRISTIFLCCILIFCCILGKLGYEQIFHHTDIMEKALSLWERDFTVAPFWIKTEMFWHMIFQVHR